MYYLTPQDFKGKFELHTGMYVNATIQDYIDRYEPIYLMNLLGAKLYDQYVADMGVFNIPISPNFQYIFNPFHENYAFNRLIISQGIIDMLKGFVYFEYLKDLTNQMTINGNVRPVGENSADVSTLYSMMYTRYNEAVKTYKAIQIHITNNFNAPIGQIISVTITNPGSGYTGQPNVPVTGGFGTGAIVAIDDIAGAVDAVYITTPGINYQVGDVLTITGGNDDAQIVVDLIGTATFKSFAGVNKSYNYWL
jgi:hypothetical protein